MQKRAFTLTELLIALGIIGAIAALCIPSLMTTINNKNLATQLQNNVASIQQAIGNQKIIKNTKDMTETAFANETDFYALFQSSKGEKCSASSTVKCWGDNYRIIGGGTFSYEQPPATAIRLKNGATIGYEQKKLNLSDATQKKNTLGEIFIDVNGPDEPNIVGRDLFGIFVYKDGTLFGNVSTSAGTCDTPSECFNALLKNNYNMPDDAHYYNTEQDCFEGDGNCPGK